ncbi:unnamed protein product [Spirodela intermedia]|uniref:Uncharacterized protein n=1 Tax=Spirodela intermedia TaxID=51605 RepID=A0A7I8LJP2_SPIIN|nr:unnamed protein product [Spirodela intermedia]
MVPSVWLLALIRNYVSPHYRPSPL